LWKGELMATQPLGTVLHYLRDLLGRSPADWLTDRDLLERFATRHEETAFAILLDRHGPMVQGVCRRILRHEQDAEDAFQATFLVLARKAGSGGWEESLGNWLYGVAYRVSLKARTAAARRIARERQAREMHQPQTPPPTDPEWSELRTVLDEELSRLPRKYRAPLVLCYLGGRTNQEAAQELGWTKGTVSGRLARARDLLRQRLTRRGLTLTGTALGALLGQNAIPHAIAAATADRTLQGALELVAGGTTASVSAQVADLVQQVLREGHTARFKLTLGLVLALSVLGAGGLLAFHLAQAGAPDAGPEASVSPDLVAEINREDGARRERDREERGPARRWRVKATFKLDRLSTALHTLAFTPDGKTLVAASGVGKILFWDLATEQRLPDLPGHLGQVTALVIAPDGKTLASASDDGAVTLWDLTTRKPQATFPGQRSQGLHLAFAPDSKTLAFGGDGGNTIQLWDVSTGKLRTTFQDHQGQILAVSFAADRQSVFSACMNGKVRRWDVESRKVLGGFDVDSDFDLGDVDQFRGFSPDGRTLVSAWGPAFRPDRLRLWDVPTGTVRATLEGLGFGVGSFAFTSDSKVLATLSQEAKLILWDTMTGRQIATFPGIAGGPFGAPLAFSPDGKMLAAGVWEVKLWVPAE
jgi:RNA polymerase sigma factor (sigma-70 family)